MLASLKNLELSDEFSPSREIDESDESGINLAIHTSERTNSIIIYVVKQENYDDCVEKLSDTERGAGGFGSTGVCS